MKGFTLPRIPALPAPGRHRRKASHREEDNPGAYRPVVPPGGSTRRPAQAAREEARHASEHRRGGGAHRAGSQRIPYRAPEPPEPYQRPQIGQPGPHGGPSRYGRQNPSGGPRRRFGDQPTRITDMAAAYRASGVPARTRAEERRYQADLVDFEAEWMARARAKKDRELRERVEGHERGRERPKGRGTTHAGTAEAKYRAAVKRRDPADDYPYHEPPTTTVSAPRKTVVEESLRRSRAARGETRSGRGPYQPDPGRWPTRRS